MSELKIDFLLGRHVVGADGRAVARLEEFRVERRGNGYVISEYVLGAAGLFERLGLIAGGIVGLPRGGYVARWDQIDLSNVEKPRLTCPLEELQKVR